jgi:diamine N-acetyltransferase
MTVMIRSADSRDAVLLAAMGRETFIQSHGHSAPEADIIAYCDRYYTEAALQTELENAGYIYSLIYNGEQQAGYSRLVPDALHDLVPVTPVSKLERLYLLPQFHGLGLASVLLEHNIRLSQEAGAKGLWLYVWKENRRAVAFYQKTGFKIIGNHDFEISATHSNPNYRMLLVYDELEY